MLRILIIHLLFVNLAVECQNATSTVSTVINNQTVSTRKQTAEQFLPMDFMPLFNFNGRTPIMSSLNYPKATHNPRNTAMQMPTDHYPYVYDPNPNLGHPIIEHETESSLKPTARHFVVVSFIGLLLLFAVIQNTMEASKRKTALVDVLSSRKKRDLSNIHSLNDLTLEEEIIFNEDDRLRCLQRMVCLQNQKLLHDFGTSGKAFAHYLIDCLKEFFNNSSGWFPLIQDAGRAGMQGDDCNIIYRACN